ncbi:MAG: hypothetical protein Ta2F_14080 [Termitinemataceae bacterium]|nr:MAG: hypothetical protein Ta2F_14080 [Termitinemataceae bacterium]
MQLHKSILAVLFFSFSVCLAYPINVTLLGGVDSESYKRNAKGQIEPVDTKSITSRFVSGLQPIGSFEVSGDVISIFEYSLKYNWDTIWLNTAVSNFNFRIKELNLGFGVFVGGNDFLMKMLDIGFLGRVGIGIEKIFFIDFNAGTSIDSKLDALDTSTRQLLNGRLGWRLPHIYTYFDFTLMKYFEKETDFAKIENSLTSFRLRSEFHSKNKPFHIDLSAGYKIHKRIYTDTEKSIDDATVVRTIFLGTGFNIRLGRYLHWIAEGDVSVDYANLTKIFPLFYSAVTGISFQYPQRDY